MSEAIAAEIKEAIGKHLPQQVSDVLQERLKQADIDAATVVTQKDKLGSDPYHFYIFLFIHK